MKTIAQIFALAIAFITLGSQQADAQFSAGAGMTFGSSIEQVGIQGDLHYQLANQPAFRFGAAFVYYFPKNDHNFYEVNVNGAYIFYEEFMLKSYLYTGLNYARSHVPMLGSGSSATDSAFGVNAGIGAEYDFGPLFGFGDLKYVFSEYNQAVFTIGLRVPF